MVSWKSLLIGGGVWGVIAGCTGATPANTAAPDGGTTPPPVVIADAGSGAEHATDVPSSVATTPVWTNVLGMAPAGTIRLAADADGVYGITSANGVWALPSGQSDARLVVPGGSDPIVYTDLRGELVVAGPNLFWLDKVGGALHRVPKDGSGGDQVLADGFDRPATLAADGTHVYWSDTTYQHQGGGVIRALSLVAAPGDAPATLVTVDDFHAISSLLATGDTLYWTSFYAIGATVYYAALESAPTAALLAGQPPTVIDGTSNAYQLFGHADALYFGYDRDLSTVAVGRLDSVNKVFLVSLLPASTYLAGLAAAGGWLVVTTTMVPRLDVHVAPAAGGGLVRIAENVLAPAVTATTGAVFVDAAGAVRLVMPAALGDGRF